MQKYGGIEKLPEMNHIYKHFQAQDQTYQLIEQEIKEEERPPISTIPEYRKKFGLDKKTS
jgi:hypothetical protein